MCYLKRMTILALAFAIESGCHEIPHTIPSGPSPSGRDETEQEASASDAFVRDLEVKNPRLVRRDSQGRPIWIHLGTLAASDHAMRMTSRVTTLKSVHITCSPAVSSKGIVALTRLPNLSELEISVPGLFISEEFFKGLCFVGSLESLRLSYVSLDMTGMSQIGELSGLRSLIMIRAGVVDSDLGHIAKLKNVEYLNLRGNRVTDGGVAQLATMTSLKVLEIDATLTQETRNRLAHVSIFGTR